MCRDSLEIRLSRRVQFRKGIEHVFFLSLSSQPLLDQSPEVAILCDLLIRHSFIHLPSQYFLNSSGHVLRPRGQPSHALAIRGWTFAWQRQLIFFIY